jgi:hypothetical protein
VAVRKSIHIGESLIPQENIENRIIQIRGRKVMLDSDLAELYGVPTSRLNEQVKRNMERFPDDFMYQLSQEEAEILRSHFAISNKGRGGRRFLPYVFTEQGVAMLSSVLNSKRAIQVNIQIMRAFTRLRELMISHKDLARKIDDLEHKFKEHDQNIIVIFQAIKELISKPSEDEKKKVGIGFHVR